MNLLDRYVIRAMLGGVFVVMAVLVALGALFLFANQQDDIGVGTYTALDAFWFVLLNLPQQVYELMPIGVLIGALLGLGTAGARQRAHGDARRGHLGVAHRRIGRHGGRAAHGGGGGVRRVPRAAHAGRWPSSRRRSASSRTSASRSRGGAWVRDGNLLINVMQQSGRAEFGGMRIYELTPDHQLASVATASTASVQPDGSWKLSRYATTRFGGEVDRGGTCRQPRCSSRRSAGISSGSPWCSRASSRRACCGGWCGTCKENGLDATQPGIRVLVAHRAHHRHPVRRVAGGAVRVRQPALGRCRARAC